MNSSIIRYILGNVMRMEACFLLLPCIVSLVYGEGVGLYYLGTAIVCLVFGVVMAWKKPKNYVFYLKEGCIATSLSWIVMSLVGCMPFWISGEIPSFTDAMFETVSGFTTTGASILTNVEALSHTALFWRSFTHWIGGMGVLVFTERWLKYKSYEGGKPWTISGQACSKDEIYRKDTLYNLFWHDHIGIYFPHYRQNACV